MEPGNAFDMLILPMLQWFAGTIATLPILHGIRVGFGRLIGQPGRPEPARSSR
jgi:hypothetical protein